ncbi:hypothetical protein Tco_0011040 [Tanacetum coccineum]
MKVTMETGTKGCLLELEPNSLPPPSSSNKLESLVTTETASEVSTEVITDTTTKVMKIVQRLRLRPFFVKRTPTEAHMKVTKFQPSSCKKLEQRLLRRLQHRLQAAAKAATEVAGCNEGYNRGYHRGCYRGYRLLRRQQQRMPRRLPQKFPAAAKAATKITVTDLCDDFLNRHDLRDVGEASNLDRGEASNYDIGEASDSTEVRKGRMHRLYPLGGYIITVCINDKLSTRVTFGTIEVPATLNFLAITREKTLDDLTFEEKIHKACDIKATNIVLQGLTSDVYTLVNHQKVAKEI